MMLSIVFMVIKVEAKFFLCRVRMVTEAILGGRGCQGTPVKEAVKGPKVTKE